LAAASILQAAARVYLARRRAAEEDIEYTEEDLAAASILQAAARVYLARRRAAGRMLAVLRIQAALRTCLARRRATTRRRAVLNIQAPDTPSLINNLTRLITGGHELGREGNQLLNETSGTATAQSTSTPRRQLSFPQGNDFGSRVATNFANFITSPRAGEAVREAARNLFTPTPAIQNETNQATIQQGQGGEAGAVAVAANDNANEQGGVEGGALVVGAANEGAVAAEGGKFTLLVRTSYFHLLTMFHFYSKHKS